MHECIPQAAGTQILHDTVSGSRSGLRAGRTSGSKRAHAGHASYAVLAVMTTLLILNGCDSPSPGEMADAQIDEAVRELKDNKTTLKKGGAHPAGAVEETGE